LKKIENELIHNPNSEEQKTDLVYKEYLEEIKDKQDLQLKQSAWILTKLTTLEDKISHTRIDAVTARRERCW
jgi:hypothetical protein